MIEKFLEAMEFRHACKLFDETRKIDENLMRGILEAGRLSPSSFGMEGWKFLVIESDDLKAKLRPLCWNQPQITTCSHLVVVLAAIENLRPASGVPQQRFARRPLPPEKIEAYVDLYAGFLAETFSSDEKTFCWSARQTYIALANMMTAAAFAEVDSCPIEGFEKEKVEALLELDTSQWQVAVLCAFGYRAAEPPAKVRLAFDDVVEFRKA